MHMDPKAEFRIGEWRVSPQTDTIARGDEVVRLEPKAMEVLVYLAARAGEVVSRGDLERDVWRGALVGYDAVTSTVIKLRKALGDNARQPQFIATVPKRGYQLMAAVTSADPGTPPDRGSPPGRNPPTPAPQPAAAQRPALLRAGLSAIALMLVTGLVAALYLLLISPDSDPPATLAVEEAVPPSVVVLPFENLSDDPAQESFADGITEDIITDLSGISDLLVIASNTAFTFKGKQAQPQQVGAELKVRYVLEGSVRRHGDSVRVNAQLVDAETGFQKWAERYDRQAAEVFAVQDEVTASIVKALALKLTHQEEKRLAQRTTNNLAAYDYFQEAQRLSRVSTRDTNLAAQAMYRKAIEADPGYSRAYGALAYTLAFAYRRGWTDAPMQTLERALELGRRAVELGPNLPQTYWALGYVHLMRKEFEQAEATVDHAVTIAPNYADGYGLLALIRNGLGKHESALALIRKGMELNPFYTWDYPYNIGLANYGLGHIDAAIAALEDAKVRNEYVVPVRLVLIASYVGAGRLGDAEWEVEELQVISPSETLSNVRRTMPSNDPELRERLLTDLRTAGLPE